MSTPAKLKLLKEEDIREIITDKKTLKNIKEPVFKLSGTAKAKKTDSLVELEIAFRKCKRSGTLQ